eukprot:1637349-Rhodomonas_salina.2
MRQCNRVNQQNNREAVSGNEPAVAGARKVLVQIHSFPSLPSFSGTVSATQDLLSAGIRDVRPRARHAEGGRTGEGEMWEFS